MDSRVAGKKRLPRPPTMFSRILTKEPRLISALTHMHRIPQDLEQKPVAMGCGIDFRTFVTFYTMTSHNAQIAKNGNAAERRLCNNEDVRKRLETYFKKPISTIGLIPGRKKSDVLVTFVDGTTCRIQNKDGQGNNRGWSTDRRAVSKMPLDDAGKLLLNVVCLKQPGERIEADCPPTLIRNLLFGTDLEYVPEYFTHSVFDKESGELLHLRISPATRVLDALTSIAYPKLVAKRTCVHISPLMYLQRKGGGKSDSAPDDIQLKLKTLPDVMETI